MEHLECIVKLSNGKLDWYDPVYSCEVLDNGDLAIDHPYKIYTIPAGDWLDYKVRPYNEDYTHYWEDKPNE